MKAKGGPKGRLYEKYARIECERAPGRRATARGLDVSGGQSVSGRAFAPEGDYPS
jgi:hypothetical protein